MLTFIVLSRFSTGIILVSVETIYDKFLLPRFLKHDEVQFSLNHQSFLPPTGQLCPKAFADFKGSSSSLIKRITRFHSCVVFLVNLVYNFLSFLGHMLESQVLAKVDRFVQEQFYLQLFDYFENLFGVSFL